RLPRRTRAHPPLGAAAAGEERRAEGLAARDAGGLACGEAVREPRELAASVAAGFGPREPDRDGVGVEVPRRAVRLAVVRMADSAPARPGGCPARPLDVREVEVSVAAGDDDGARPHVWARRVAAGDGWEPGGSRSDRERCRESRKSDDCPETATHP